MESKESSLNLPKYLDKQVKTLSEYEGSAVVTVIKNGNSSDINAILIGHSKGCYIDRKNESSLPLLGRGTAIKKVVDDKNNIIWENPAVNVTYCLANSDAIRKECGFD